MTDQRAVLLEAWNDLSATTDVLLASLEASDEDKAHEAVSVMLMQGLNYFGSNSVAMKQCFTVWDAIKLHIDRSDLTRALSQARRWRAQLDEIISIVGQEK